MQNQKRSVLDIPLFDRIYTLYKVLHTLFPQIPKIKCYTLWDKCERHALDLLELLFATSHFSVEKRVDAIHLMSQKLDLLKVLIRLAKETQTLSPKHYLEIQSLLQEIGKMIGGWLKFASHKAL